MGYPEQIVWQVWAKGIILGNNDPLLWRKDECGAWMLRSHYGAPDSEYGWEIDHIKPLSEGGTDDISNLRPLQCQNKLRRPDGSLDCHVTAEGYRNVMHVPNY